MSSSAAVLGDSGRSLAAGDGEAARDPLSISAEVKSSLSLLIVDDDRTLREGCASVLQMDGYNVTTSRPRRRSARDRPPAQVRHRARRSLHDAGLRDGDPQGDARPRTRTRSSS